MTWLWSRFKGKSAQSAREKRVLDEAPAPMAWIWSGFKGELLQSESEKRALREAPAPMAWIWSGYKGELPQSESEKQLLLERCALMTSVRPQPAAETAQSIGEQRASSEAPSFAPAQSELKETLPQIQEWPPGPLRVSSDEERPRPVGRDSAAPTKIAKAEKWRSPWLLTGAAAIVVLALAVGVGGGFLSGDKAAAPQNTKAASTTSIGPKAVSPAPKTGAVQQQVGEASTNAPKGAPEAPAGEASPALTNDAPARAETIDTTTGAETPPIAPAPAARAASEIAATEAQPDKAATTPPQPVGGASGESTRLEAPVDLPAANSGVEAKLSRFLQVASNKSGEFDLDRISFDAANAALSASSAQQLQNVAKVLAAFPDTTIAINAYAQRNGKKPNLKLPWERANAVLRELARNGVDKSRMTTQIFKRPHPAEGGDAEEGPRQKPRISLTVTRR